jgi:hypothetical protein
MLVTFYVVVLVITGLKVFTSKSLPYWVTVYRKLRLYEVVTIIYSFIFHEYVVFYH